MRGIPGSHSLATRSIGQLLEEAYRAGLHRRLFLNMVLTKWNLEEMGGYVEMARGLGVHGVLFQMLTPTFGLDGESDPFFEENRIGGDPESLELVARWKAKFEDDPFVVTEGSDFDWMDRFARDPDFRSNTACASHERNLIVNMWGDVQLCWNMQMVEGNQGVPKYDGSLARILQDAGLARTVDRMKECTRNCGMLNCHREIAGEKEWSFAQ
jgi:MoaA/NifB/PqqE/SkfB family radical SAM enzyme